MDRDTIIRLAREAGLLPNYEVYEDDLERFAALVAAHKREECAKLCDELVGKAWVEDCAAAIRSRT